MQHTPASREVIVAAAKRVVAQRETWADKGYYTPEQDRYDGTWRVTVHKIAEVQPTEVASLLFSPGTGRELLFSRGGKFISWARLP